MEKENNNNPLISIIVPVYKVEQYLERCIESVLRQTFRDFELILVDDGSPDCCGSICERYAAQDARIRVIHQENQGQAAARNHAVQQANGAYIVFVDSDDYVEPDCLEYLMMLKNEYEADMTIGGFTYLYEGKQSKSRSAEEKEEVLGACQALIRMNYTKGFGATPWAKLYKKELIVKHPFPEGQIYEDLATLYKIVGDCETIAVGTRKIYYWLQRSGSTMRTEFDERQMAGMDAAAAQIPYIKERFPMALQSAKYRYTAKAVELMAVCFNSGGSKEVFRRLKRLMNRFAGSALKDRNSSTTMRLRIIAAKLGYYPAKIVFRIHEKAKHRFA